MICERYDVVVVPFPFAEIPVIKKRPVFVLSSHQFNNENGNTLVGMITTAKKTAWPGDIDIKNMEMAGLKTRCVARWRLITVPNDLILRKIGRIDPLDQIAFEHQRIQMLI